MGLIVFWTDFAKNELKSIFEYHKQKVSLKIARQIAKQIVEKSNALENFPEIGVVDELIKRQSSKLPTYYLSTYSLSEYYSMQSNISFKKRVV